MPEEIRITVVDDQAAEGPGAGSAAVQQDPSDTGGVADIPFAEPIGPSVPPPAEIPVAEAIDGEEDAASRLDTAMIGRQLESVAKSLAGGNVGGAAAGAGSAAGGALAAMLGPAGIAVTAFASTVAVATVALKSFASMVKTQVSELAGLSPEVAMAQATTDLRQEEAAIRRAEQIGPQVARAEDTRSRFEESMTDLWTQILDGILKIGNNFEPLINMVGSLVEVTATSGVMQLLADMVIKLMPVLSPLLWVINKIAELPMFNRDDDEDPLEDWAVNEFLDMLPARPQFWPRGMGRPDFMAPEPGV